MPITPTYPGVYVEEIPSGVRTIVGVATSITAFVGRASRGPVNEAVTINSFGDFERQFGGLGVDYPMSYAVRDFYLNGGSQAIIIRLYKPFFKDESERQKAQADAQKAADAVAKAATDAAAVVTPAPTPQGVADAATGAVAAASAGSAAAKAAAEAVAKAATDAVAIVTPAPTPQTVAKAATDAAAKAGTNAAPRGTSTLKIGNLTLEAASAGKWGDDLRVRVDNKVSDDVATRYGLAKTKLFNLTVRDMKTGVTEKFLNVTGEESPRRIDRALLNESALIKVPSDAIAPFPVPNAHPDPVAGKTVWEDPNASTAVAGDGKAADSQALDQAAYEGSRDGKTGMFALEQADLFNLLCIPPDTRDSDTLPVVYQTARKYCLDRRALLIVDPPNAWNSANSITANNNAALTALGLSSGDEARNAALFFPRVIEADSLRDGQADTFVPCGIVAGVMARTDTQRGVWKAPAGIDAALNGTQGLKVNLTDPENGQLNPLGVNCLRSFPVFGRVVWGARTLRGADQAADEYKYIPVRRTALFIEESLFRGLKWVVFEPNDEPLWAQIRLNAGAFMHNMFRQGAFQGKTPREAYFVKCDKDTTTQNDINLGIVNVVVGFAPLKPAEFVIIKLQQMAGQIDV
jgi:phage tail sheath protein FI